MNDKASEDLINLLAQEYVSIDANTISMDLAFYGVSFIKVSESKGDIKLESISVKDVMKEAEFIKEHSI